MKMRHGECASLACPRSEDAVERMDGACRYSDQFEREAVDSYGGGPLEGGRFRPR